MEADGFTTYSLDFGLFALLFKGGDFKLGPFEDSFFSGFFGEETGAALLSKDFIGDFCDLLLPVVGDFWISV